MQNLYRDLEKILLSKDDFKSGDGKILKNKVTELAVANDKTLVSLLLKNTKLKKHFFDEIEKGVISFNKEKFIRFVSNKEFLPNSFTAFTNKIGLHDGTRYLHTNEKVSLVWPYKDCVLEGGQDKEEQRRSEIFYNETLAPDEIDRLYEKKVLTNFKKYTKKGTELPKEIAGTDNLIIRGNNLLALQSLREKYAGKVKLIYIDPPYNTGGDGFNYNDKFNHSTWLTFMKNRLEVARELMRNDGSIFISIDNNELGYLQVLMDEIFGIENRQNIITIKRSSVSGAKVVNTGVVNVSEFLIIYSKDKSNWSTNRVFRKKDRDKRYNTFISNKSKSYKDWKFCSVLDAFAKEVGVPKSSLKKHFGDNYSDELESFYLKNSGKIIRFVSLDEKSVSDAVINLKKESVKNPAKVFKLNRKDKLDYYIHKGQGILFFEDRLIEIGGKKVFGELIHDIWDDVLPNDLHNEGGVSLRKGKKPEKLIHRILQVATNEGDLVLDYHLGSGTTAAVCHKIKRQYIGIEQLDYGKDDSVKRLVNVIKGDDKSGISKAVKWKDGGSFVYAELMENNQSFVDEVEKAKTSRKLIAIYKKMQKEAFFRYEVDLSSFDVKEFGKLELEDQKQVLLECLDKNHLYVNYGDIDDTTYKVSPADKKLNKLFYSK